MAGIFRIICGGRGRTKLGRLTEVLSGSDGGTWDRGWGVVDCVASGRCARMKGVCAEEGRIVDAGIGPVAAIPGGVPTEPGSPGDGGREVPREEPGVQVKPGLAVN